MPDAPAASAATPTYSHQQILRVVTGIMLCMFLASLDQTVIIPAVPAIAGDLNAFGHLSWIVTAYLLTATAATPIYGKLSDNYGRRELMMPALTLFIVASMACGFAQTLPELIVARAFQGLGGAGLFAMSQAAIADVVAPRERGRYQGYMASVWGVSSIAGPILGGWATEHLSWRWVFWANLPVGLVAMVLCNRALKLVHAPRRAGRIDWGGAALVVSAVTAWLLLLSWGGSEYPWASAPIIGLGVLGIALLPLLVWWERRASDPIMPPVLFANPSFSRGVLIAFCTSLGLFGATFLLPLYFQLVQGHDAAEAGLLVMPYMASNVIGALLSGRAARRLGRTKGLICAGLAACVLSFAGMTALSAGAPLVPVLLCSFVLGLGTGATMPSTLVQVQNAAERRHVGAATGSLLFLRSMGGAFGATVVGALLSLRFASGLQAMGVTREIDLGALRGQGLSALGGLSLEQARTALSSGFQLGFGACALVLALALVAALSMADVRLRSGVDLPKDAGH